MKRHLDFSIGLVVCLTLATSLTHAPMAQAGDTWRGTSSFSTKITAISDDDPKNIKFANVTMPMTGTIELYTEKEDLVPNGQGCYIRFFNEDGTAICFKNIAAISTLVQKSKSDQLLLIGTGDFIIKVMGISLSGIIYLDTKGTLRKDASGNLISIGVSGKIGGASDLAVVFSGSINTTLTK